METFSERYGYSKPGEQLERESMTQELRVGLWNVIYEKITFHNPLNYTGRVISFQKEIVNYFQKPADEFFDSKTILLLKCFFKNEETKWFEIYGFIEFIISCMANSDEYEYNDRYSIISFINDCNAVLKKEKSAWQIDQSSGLVVPLVGQPEMDSINKAIQSTVHGGHIKKALEYSSRKENPDYENSIKESILAVESLVKTLCQSEKATLGDLLEKLKEMESTIHPALLKGFSNLYGFTSDAGGIRHGSGGGKLEGDFETALYMLASCSAFCNFLESKYKKRLK